MQVVLHAGVHGTDDDRLVSSLIKNRDQLAQHGTDVPSPGAYRKLIRVALRNADITGVDEMTRDALMAAIAPADEPGRLILSSPSLFGPSKTSANGGVLYSQAESRLGALTRMFPEDEIDLFVAIRNPATFLPSAFETSNLRSMEELLHGTDPTEVRWSDLIRRLRAAHPAVPITVWCNEDTPIIWAHLLREVAGLDHMTELEDEFLLLAEIMSETGLQRFYSYLDSHPGMSELQKRRIIAAFLDKYAEDSAIEEEIDVPSWTAALVDHLTDLYDEDLYAIQRIPGVVSITP